MKRLGRLVSAFFLAAGLAACAHNPAPDAADNPAAEQNRLLVTFADRGIARSVAGYALDNYPLNPRYRNSGWSERLAGELAERHQLQLISQWPITELGVSCVVYQIAEQSRLQQAIRELQAEPDVAAVQSMHGFQVLAGQAAAASPAGDPYLQLQSGYQSLGIGDLHQTSTGRGVSIAIVDTGVDLGHPDLQGQIKYAENLGPEPADHNLADAHGTAVAGIIAARPGNGIGIAGIAPEADILAFRACWPLAPGALAARCNSLTLALALNQALRMDSRIINLSLGGPEDQLLRQLIEKALSKGVIVIAAVAGEVTIGGFPANIPGVIAVGRDGQNPAADMTAPGQDILTTVPHQAYEFMTGSSFAAPHVAGVAALLLQLHPDWRTQDVLRLLGNHLNRLTAGQLQNGTPLAARESDRQANRKSVDDR
ncbi:MAG: S8 family serine peptidase [Methylomonas sp.]|jgi:subtilisin family serine protease